MKFKGFILKQYEYAYEVASVYGMIPKTAIKWGVFATDGTFISGPFYSCAEAKRYVSGQTA